MYLLPLFTAAVLPPPTSLPLHTGSTTWSQFNLNFSSLWQKLSWCRYDFTEDDSGGCSRWMEEELRETVAKWVQMCCDYYFCGTVLRTVRRLLRSVRQTKVKLFGLASLTLSCATAKVQEPCWIEQKTAARLIRLIVTALQAVESLLVSLVSHRLSCL